MAKILDGKQLSAHILQELSHEVSALSQRGKSVGLAVVIVGDDPASHVYVGAKKRACGQIGIVSTEHALAGDVSQEELLALIDRMNGDPAIDGILVQLPLPAHINETVVLNAISPQKDVDAFHPVNVGRLMIGRPDFLPCTPAGIMELIAESGISLSGKECVVVGRSNIVGKPIAMLLLQKDATVTVCHSKTRDLDKVVARADVVVAAVGRPEMIRGEMIKEGAVVIDVGVNRLEGKRLTGDVHFESCEKKAMAITPVPGGVGPMTISMLMKNTVKSASLRLERGE